VVSCDDAVLSAWGQSYVELGVRRPVRITEDGLALDDDATLYKTHAMNKSAKC
jgi:hypothetical protein